MISSLQNVQPKFYVLLTFHMLSACPANIILLVIMFYDEYELSSFLSLFVLLYSVFIVLFLSSFFLHAFP
jgi:hypothetical protein